MKNDKEITEYFEKLLGNKKLSNAKIFDELKKNYKLGQYAKCLNYIIENKDDTKLLEATIREINKHKFIDNLSVLINFISQPKKETMSDSAFSNLRVLAIKTISCFKNSKSVDALLVCLNDKNSNYRIRLAAAEALGKIGDKNAFESLHNIICDENEKSVFVKESAVAALGMLGDNRAIDVFDSIINTKQMFQEKFHFLKERIIEAMGRLETSKSDKALDIFKVSILDASENIRINTIEALMNSNLRESYSLIHDRLVFDDSLEVKKNALIALYNISDTAILKEVIDGNFERELKELASKIYEEETSDEQ